jgi:hypothetical protein
MKLNVLDRNYCQLPELKSYLLEEENNFIVITSDFISEAFKPLPTFDVPSPVQKITQFQGLINDFKILKKFKNQTYYCQDRAKIFHYELPLQKEQLLDLEGTKKLRELMALDEENLKIALAQEFREKIKLDLQFHKNFNETYIFGSIKEYQTFFKENKFVEYRDINLKLKTVYEHSLLATKQYLKEIGLKIKNPVNSVVFLHNFVSIWRLFDLVFNHSGITKVKNESEDVKYVFFSCFFTGLLTKEKWMIPCRFLTMNNYEKSKIISEYSSYCGNNEIDQLVTDCSKYLKKDELIQLMNKWKKELNEKVHFKFLNEQVIADYGGNRRVRHRIR